MTVALMERKLTKALRRRKALTAGELAERAGLQSADGSGRAVSRPLGNLVAQGVAVACRSTVDRRNRYTRA